MSPSSSPPLRDPFVATPAAPPLTPEAAALLSHLLGHPTEPATRSLYTQLLPYHSASDAQLDPAPHINHTLTALVNAVQGTSSFIPAPRPDPARDASTDAHHRFAALQNQVCAAVDASPALQARAAVLRGVAQRAESRLELHYVPVLLASGYRADGPPPTLDGTTTTTPTTTKTPHAVLTNPVAEARAARIAAAAKDFPYISNYVTMVRREAAVIRAFCHRPVRHVVFCGSGPLALTGMLLGAHLGARVTMVDCDGEAVARSRELLSAWGRRGVLDVDGIEVVHAACEELSFVRCDDGENVKNGPDTIALPCDVLFVAALIPQAAKEVVARRVAAAQADGPLLVTRSAHGLTARLAYDESGRGRLGRLLEFVGTVVPRTHELADGRIVDETVKPIELFESEILNSLELYRWRASGATA